MHKTTPFCLIPMKGMSCSRPIPLSLVVFLLMGFVVAIIWTFPTSTLVATYQYRTSSAAKTKP